MSTSPMAGEMAVRQKHKFTADLVPQIKAALTEQGLPDQLFKYTDGEDVFLFRPLLRGDWLQIQAYLKENQNKVDNDAFLLKVCEKCVVWPDIVYDPVQWEIQRAGLQSSLAKFILARSGFADPELDQDAYLRVEPVGDEKIDPKPDRKLLDSIQKEYEWSLRLIQVCNRWYLVRPLKRIEWKILQDKHQDDNENLELATALRGTVWSSTPGGAQPDFGEELAGAAAAVAGVVTQSSGFFSAPLIEEL